MKLKTLKDIDRFYSCCDEEAYMERIQEEAINWIKSMENILDNYYEEAEGKLSLNTVIKRLKLLGFKDWWAEGTNEDILGETRSIINFIKHFFNITEGDIK